MEERGLELGKHKADVAKNLENKHESWGQQAGMITGLVRSYAVSAKLGDELGRELLKLDLANLNGQSELPLVRVSRGKWSSRGQGLVTPTLTGKGERYEISNVAREKRRDSPDGSMKGSPYESVSTIRLCTHRERSRLLGRGKEPLGQRIDTGPSMSVAGLFKFHRCRKEGFQSMFIQVKRMLPTGGRRVGRRRVRDALLSRFR